MAVQTQRESGFGISFFIAIKRLSFFMEAMLRYPRAPLLWLLLPLLTGYAVAEWLAVNGWLLGAGAAVLTLLTFLLGYQEEPRKLFFWKLSLLAGGVLLSAAYYQHRTASPDRDGLPPREAHVTIRTERLFGSGQEGPVRGFARIRDADPHLEELVGQRIYFSMLGSSDAGPFPRGTRLQVSGILKPVEAETGGSFANFLRRSGVRFELIRAELLDGDPVFRGIGHFAHRTNQRFENFLRQGDNRQLAEADVLVAMLLGKRAELSENQRQAFLFTGTLHLFAISGLHVGVIALAIHTVLLLLRVPRRAGVLIGLTSLYLFVEITGASPSAVRAFLMVAFFWGAHFAGRSPNPIAALTGSAVAVLILFPHQLWSPGFQLSYSVVSGILLLGLPLGHVWAEKFQPYRYLPEALLSKPQKWLVRGVRGLIQSFAVSLSATLLSSPLSIYYFGVFTPGAVFLNLLLIPLASLVLTAGFVSILLSLLGVVFLPMVFNHAAWLLIAGMERAVHSAPTLPGLFWQAAYRAEWMGVACLSCLLASLLAGFYLRWRPAPALCLAPFAVFLVFLLMTVQLTFLPE
jgi:competence protein ComEC